MNTRLFDENKTNIACICTSNTCNECIINSPACFALRDFVIIIHVRCNNIFVCDFPIKVLKAGEILEYDRPRLLLSNPESYLLKLVNQTGPLAAEKLKAMAKS